ncbi:hypothetical protein K1T71_001057 [Dendrolimus kikuchii]|uniref:Uncharacterized protein n=1 Tax=Dendrolimus kikuchii TaxID=765133 RepID=A0ACC1DGV0_9NEOP|nr:hypothetical protein K1T71_001057 [Dendrolimus kikuchii]
MSDYGFSDIECKIILAQIERRAKYRQEFLKQRTDPCKHSLESGYVFDAALQRFMSMKDCQYEYFHANPKNIAFGIFSIILPMSLYGYAIWKVRTHREREIRCGRIKYRDRNFKLA